AADGCVQVGRVEPPLLACVASKERLVELAPYPRDDGVLRVLDASAGFGPRGQKSFDPGNVQVEIVQAIDRRAVDRDRYEAFVDTRQDPVLVRNPSGERAQ